MLTELPFLFDMQFNVYNNINFVITQWAEKAVCKSVLWQHGTVF